MYAIKLFYLVGGIQIYLLHNSRDPRLYRPLPDSPGACLRQEREIYSVDGNFDDTCPAGQRDSMDFLLQVLDLYFLHVRE